MENQEKNNSFEEIYEKLAASRKILMTLHKGPDGDSIGSCAAMKTFLENLGKNVTLISPDNVSETYEDFYFVKEIEFGKTLEDFNLNDFDVVLVLDSGVPSQIKTTEDFLKTGFIINIDHHGTNPRYGNLNYVEHEKPSTASILMEFFETLEKKEEFENKIIDKDVATKLIFGVYTDSRGFTARNAVQALKDGVKLIDKGAEYLWMIENMKTSLRLKKFYTYIINNMEYKDNIVWSTLPNEKIKEFNLTLSEVRTGIVELRSLKEFDIAFTLSELEPEGKKIKVSFRCDRGYDVSKFAQALGGGGHKGAASAYLENMSLEEAKNKVLEIIEKHGDN